MPTTNEAALPYHEPSIETILIQASFMILLNLFNWALDAILYCGLIGQILVGIAWGTPGGKILSSDAEQIFVELGYVGLILLVFEGGLSTSFKALKANSWLSAGVAFTGIVSPIGLSFILGPLAGASSLQSFAAGAALCSTSLGTTFTVLNASKLTSTRLGVVLTSAAILDDVVGLVMVQVISNLGAAAEVSVSAVTIIQPVFVSIGFAIAAVVFCRFVLGPSTVLLNKWRVSHPRTSFSRVLERRATALILHSALLIGLVTGSSYAGTSNLFAAYIAGSIISWWDSEVPHPVKTADHDVSNASPETSTPEENSGQARTLPPSKSRSNQVQADSSSCSGEDIYEHFYGPPLKWVLQPLFFASIGFSVPIRRLFEGPIVWKGIIYSILMVFGKLLCGLWLVRVPSITTWAASRVKKSAPDNSSETRPSPSIELDEAAARSTVDDTSVTATGAGQSPAEIQNSTPDPSKPLSLYPGVILGLAMVARGEIGFLISSVAQSRGVFGRGPNNEESDIFLIATWAIVLCTIIGPLCVGLVVRRVRRLEVDNTRAPANVLGVWGVGETS
ncbi:cation/H+ exchanger [Nemania sp. FL0916]|nr:cation/H+ exchanger [Nemania sp. FL0916]